jgi:hypothetical protein
MTTKFIGVKDFRQNMAEYAKQAQKSRAVRFVVMSRNKPLFAVTPFDEDEDLDYLFETVMLAKAEADAGKVVTQARVLENLNS